MAGILETAAVTTAIATATTTLGIAGYGNMAARKHAKLLEEAVYNKEGGPLMSSPVGNVSASAGSAKKGPLKTAGVAVCMNNGPVQTAAIEFNGEILHITKTDGSVRPAMALGGTNVTIEGKKVTAKSREPVPPSITLTFESTQQANKWAKEMQDASNTSSQHDRIQELIEHVLQLEKHIKDLRTRAQKVNELENDNKKLERLRKKAEGDDGKEKKEKKEGKEKKDGKERVSEGGSQGEGAEGSSIPIGEEESCKQLDQMIASGSDPIEAAKAKLAQSATTVKKLTEELQILKAAAASAKAGSANAVSPEEQAMIMERLNAAEAKRREVEVLASALTSRLESLTPRQEGGQKIAELEDLTDKLSGRLEALTPRTVAKQVKDQLEAKAIMLDQRMTELERLGTAGLSEDQEEKLCNLAQNHGNCIDKAGELERRLLLLEDRATAQATVVAAGADGTPFSMERLIAAEVARTELDQTATELCRRLAVLEGGDDVVLVSQEETERKAVELLARLEALENRACSHQGDIENYAAALHQRLNSLEGTRGQELENLANKLDARCSSLEASKASKPFSSERQQEIEQLATQLSNRVDQLEAERKSGGGGAGGDADVAPLMAKIREQQDFIAGLQADIAAGGGPPDEELVGRLKAAETERSSLQEITNNLYERLLSLEKSQEETAPDAALAPVIQGIPIETHEALRREFEALQQAGPSLDDIEILRRQLVMQQEQTAAAEQMTEAVISDRNLVMEQLEVLQTQSQNQSRDMEPQASPLQTQADLAQLEEKLQLELRVEELQKNNMQQKMEADTEIRLVQAELAQMRAQSEQAQAMAEEFSLMQGQVNLMQGQLEEATQLQADFITNENNLNARIQQLQQALSDNAANSPVQDPRVALLQQEAEMANMQMLEQRQVNESMQRQMQEAIGDQNKLLQQEQLIIDLQTQLNQVVVELEVAQQASSSASVEDQITAERQQATQKIKVMEDKQEMLTKEFEAEYTEIRRKEAQMGRKWEEEKLRADTESSNTRLLLEEKQQLLLQMEQLKVKLLETGNSANIILDLQQRVRDQEQMLVQAQAESRQAQALDQALVEARLKSQSDARKIQELNLQLQDTIQRASEIDNGQVNLVAQEELIRASQAKAEEYYQQVMMLSASNDQLKAEQAYLVTQLENKKSEAPRMEAGDQQVIIVKLSEENGDLKAQLAQTWAKINEQTKKIEEERTAFWQELEAVRTKEGEAPLGPPPNRMAGVPGNVTLTAGQSTMPSKPSSSLTPSFPQQQRAGVSRQPAPGLSREQVQRQSGIPGPVPRSSPSGGVAPRAVPTRQPAGAAEPRQASSPLITNSRPGLSYGNVGGFAGGPRESLAQPISTGLTAPSRR